ncbi:Prenyltransferase and squalene oxidase repeat-containing protein [Candidatus Methanophagaceae archaeon]|nr:Prenyltransferase and squalene oxidase repeat-containing protein [Methanophagales archaeon]
MEEKYKNQEEGKMESKNRVLLIGIALLVLYTFVGTISTADIYVPSNYTKILWAIDNATAEGNYWSDYTGVDDSCGTGKFLNENGLITTNCSPSWHGTVIIDCESLDNWSVESDIGSYGNLTLVPGFIGKAVQLNWDIGTGDWVQAKYTFQEPINLSNYDIFGVSFHGSDSTPNCVSLMFADTHDVFYGWDCDGLNSIDRWMKNLAVPRKLFYKFWDWNTTDVWDEIDWSNINRFFFVVKCPAPMERGGQLTIDHLQVDRAQQWSRQEKFYTSTGDPNAARNAVDYILTQQKATGLFLSWKEEPSPKAWLYDQALVLHVLTREGTWLNGNPSNNESLQADKLVNFIANQQIEDGHWPRSWNPETGKIVYLDEWVGDQAWMTFALQTYRLKSGNDSVEPIINNASEWLKNKIEPSGKVVNSTEGNVDVWWAMIATGNIKEAERIEEYLLSIWDGDLKYWPRGSNDSFVAMDCQTWLSHFARSPWVNEEEKGMESLSFARRTLVTTDENDTICGFDGMGPVSVWCEGTAQYIAAGGEDSQFFLDNLMSIQNPDGSLPGCPDKKTWNSCFGWLSPWSGLAPTAWFYFAITGDPFISIFDTGPGTYLSIMGTHNGTITPSTDIFVHRMFTYSCSGTGGHSECVKIWNETWNVTANWNGYKGDWRNISFNNSFILEKGKTYNYTIRTGSYPQIVHADSMVVAGGTINCTSFIDTNGNEYEDWIPAIRLGE